MPEPARVRAMFGRIAGRYDVLNRLLSGGIDRRWRRATVRAAERMLGTLRDRTFLDVACGTADLSLAFARSGARVLGVDFTFEMLAAARPKLGRPGSPVVFQGDALALPVADDSVDAASIAFGIRNVADRRRGLVEMARVVRPGGVVIVLEFSMPPNRVLRSIYRTYFTRVLPVVGGWISGDRGAYEYLPESVLAWPGPDEFRRELEDIGLVDCEHRPLTGGIACLHWGRVSGGRPR